LTPFSILLTLLRLHLYLRLHLCLRLHLYLYLHLCLCLCLCLLLCLYYSLISSIVGSLLRRGDTAFGAKSTRRIGSLKEQGLRWAK
jgi:hypothetical protein